MVLETDESDVEEGGSDSEDQVEDSDDELDRAREVGGYMCNFNMYCKFENCKSCKICIII